MKLTELIKTAQASLDAHGDMDVELFVNNNEAEVVHTDCFQCKHLTGSPWLFFLGDDTYER